MLTRANAGDYLRLGNNIYQSRDSGTTVYADHVGTVSGNQFVERYVDVWERICPCIVECKHHAGLHKVQLRKDGDKTFVEKAA